MIQTILVLVALSPRASAVAAEACRLARLLSARVIVLHVGTDTADTRGQLQQSLHQIGCDDLGIELIIRAGRVETVLAQVIADGRVDLVVAGALEREGVFQYYTLGSIARRVARSAASSVLLFSNPRLNPSPFHRIVASVSLDASSKAMLALILHLAKLEGAEADIVSEYESPGLNQMLGDGLDSRREDASKRLLQTSEKIRLAAFVDDLRVSDVNVRLLCLPGKHGTATIQYAQKSSADLLCFATGSASLTFWDKLFRHGVEFALERLPCNLLLFRPKPRC